jgi:signal peptidase I
VSESDDLRSRIEAQIEARRHKGKGRHSRSNGHPAGHLKTTEDGFGDAHAPRGARQPGHSAAAGTRPARGESHPVQTTPGRRSTGRRALHERPPTASPIADTQIIEPVRPDDVHAERQPRGRRRRRPGVMLRLLVLIAVAGMLAVSLRTFVVEPFWIPSESMEQTLHGCSGCNDDRLLVDKLSYKLHGVHRGDVVVFHRPPGVDAAEEVLIKRVIGLSGETVSGHDGKVWIGSRMLEESYVNGDCRGTRDFDRVKVPPGDVFVMGDNRCDSTDSRVFGPIKKSSILGRAFLIIWPLGRIHWL